MNVPAIAILAASETTTAWIAAAAGIGGVLIGGLITTGTTAYFERKRDKGDIRQARRLVLEEVRTNSIQAKGVCERGRYPPTFGPPQFLPTEQWESNRSVLARHLDGATWDNLSLFMDTIPSIRVAAALEGPNAQVPANKVKGLERARDLAPTVYSLLSGGDSI